MGIGVKLSRLRTEDMIWIIYLFIAIAALISDKYEKDYLVNKNINSKNKFRLINITILIIAFFIYLYFVLINYEDVTSLKKNITKKEVITSHVALIAALLFLIAGILNIWVELSRGSIEDDIGII